MTARLPASAADFTPEWLTAALALQHPGVRVAGVDVRHETERTNRHLRLRLTYDVEAGAPSTVFVKVPPLDPEHRRSIDATGMGRREVRFYIDVAPTLSMRVPHAFMAAADDDGNFIVLMEDLVANGATVSDGSWAIPGKLAVAALDDLAAMHVHFEQPGVLAATAPWASVKRVKGTDFTVRTLRYVLDNCREQFSDSYAAVAELYIDHHAAFETIWDAGPHTFIHGDAHIGNLFIEHGRVGFLDWGLVRVAPAMRDVSFFLTMGVESSDRRDRERDLIRHYLEARCALGGVEIDFDDAWMAHRLHAAYTVIASFLTMVAPYNSEKRRMFTTNFRARAMAALDDLDTVDALRGAISAAER